MLAIRGRLPYARHDMGGRFGFTPAYPAMNPNALLPMIEDDGVVLWAPLT